MKPKNFKPLRAFIIMALTIVTGIAACTNDLITQNAGSIPDRQTQTNIGSTLRSKFSLSGKAKIDLVVEKDQDPKTVEVDELFCFLGQPATRDVKVTLRIGTEFTNDYHAEIDRINAHIEELNMAITSVHTLPKVKKALFPAKNVHIESNNLIIPSGKNRSKSIRISLLNDSLDQETIYLLPIEVDVMPADDSQQPQTRILQYLVRVHPNVMETFEGFEKPLTFDDEFTTVFYVNTETYQPLVADIFMYRKDNDELNTIEKFCFIGNLINLKTVTVDYDAVSQRPLLNLSSDIRYVLENAEKYIRPLQNRGRKVCLCIEGGNKGIGFCNMNDAQIADFVAQTKQAIEHYRLDGINLWDDGSGYDKEGMPPINTTSYPKLIKALRQAMPETLLTLVDVDEPTATFHDTGLTGGIRVGEYIDYAWHGYFSEKEQLQIIEPWAADQPYGTHTRQPIAGLNPARYGNINCPRYGFDSGQFQRKALERVVQWKSLGRKQNNIMVFGFDLTANEQGVYEGQPLTIMTLLRGLADEAYSWGADPWTGEIGLVSGKYYYRFMSTLPRQYHTGYRLLAKDW